MDWDHKLVCRTLPYLVLHNTDSAVYDIGANHLADIATSLTGIQEQGESQPLACTKRPSPLEGGDLLVGPSMESAETIACQAGERVVLSNVRRDGIGHD